MSTAAYVYKIVVIGDAAVGKTSTVIRFAKGWFRQDYLLTVGVQHYARTIEIGEPDDATKIKLIIWDMAGQEWFKEVRANFYDGTCGVVLMCDITRKETFEHLPKWLQEAWENIGHRVPVHVVANKADLLPHRVKIDDIKGFAAGLGAPFMMTSAKTGAHVSDLFFVLGSLVHKHVQGKKETRTGL